MSATKSTLIDMGFSSNKVEKAIQVTGDNGVEVALSWLLEHANDPDLPETELSDSSNKVLNQNQTDHDASNTNNEPNDVNMEAKSIKCDECNKLFKTSLEVEYHSLKSGHKQFSESLEEKRPLTAEEKKEQLRLLEEKLKEKRKLREIEEKKEALEKEKTRIKTGKSLTEAKKNLQDLEIKKMVEQRKREKEEEKIARERIKAQIEQDKLNRKLQAQGKQPDSVSIVETKKDLQSDPIKPKAEYLETKIQIRLTNGAVLTQNFGCREELSAVRLFVEMNRTDGTGPFVLMTNFPKKVFNDSDYEMPLEALGLVPSAVIIMQKQV